MTNSDADLVARCRSGDVDAFETLYRQHAPRIYSLACRLSGSNVEGEDLLQEIFLLAHQRLSTFRGEASVGSWIYRLAMNRCLDYVRGRQMKMARMTDRLESDTSKEPAARIDTLTERMDLDRAIQSLPSGYREAFVLHDVEGFGHGEISEMLGIAEGTSKSQVAKARMKLRALLQP